MGSKGAGEQGERGFLYRTPDEALVEITQRQVIIDSPLSAKAGSRCFQLVMPKDMDALLDHPAIHQAFDQDEYIPYWAELWPAAQMLGQALLQASLPTQTTALEIGCGLGVPGLVALSLGLRVIFSDYDATALQFAAKNALGNGFTDFETLPMDWRCPPQNLQVPLILAADVIYEARNLAPIITLIEQLLLPTGECWLVDPDRSYGADFRQRLDKGQLVYTTQALQYSSEYGPIVHGTLYRIRKQPISK